MVGYLLEYGWSMVMMAALSVVVAVRDGFDVVHAHNPPDVLVLIGAIYKLFGKRFVFDHHDLAPEMYRRPVRRLGQSDSSIACSVGSNGSLSASPTRSSPPTTRTDGSPSPGVVSIPPT